MESVGIDDLSAIIPNKYIETEELAYARGVPQGKFTNGIGIKKIGICTENENVATMASSAINDLMEKNDLKPKDIGRISAATETAMDESKPITSFIIGEMEKSCGKGSFVHVQSVEYKFACLSGSYALLDICNWISSAANIYKRLNRIGIVVCTDEAKYDFLSSGEPTQGAGAVAILIKANPRLVDLDFDNVGVFTSDINDFFRPFGKETPIVNSKLSTFSYLYAMRESFDSYLSAVNLRDRYAPKNNFDFVPTDVIDYFVLHTPYPNLVKHAAAMLIRHELRYAHRWKADIENLHSVYNNNGGKSVEEIFSDGETFEKDYQLRKNIMRTEEFERFYERKVEPGMWIPSEVGNTYTAAIFLSFISMLELEGISGKNRLKEGQKIAFGAYGSGAGALGYQGVVADGFRDVVSNIEMKEKMNSRERMSIGEYEVSRMLGWGKKKYGEYKDKYGETAKKIAKIGVDKAVKLLGEPPRPNG